MSNARRPEEGRPGSGSEELSPDSDGSDALRRIARLVSDGAPRSTLFRAVLDAVGGLAEWVAIARYEGGCAVTVASWGEAGESGFPGSRTPLGGRTVPTLVFETHRQAAIDRPVPGEAAVGAPIRAGGRLWGVLAAGSSMGTRPTEGAAERLAAAADLLGAGIAGNEERDELRRIADEQAAMRRLALLVARGVEPALLFAAVAEEVALLFGADAAAVVRSEPDGTAVLVGSSGWGGPRSGAGDDPRPLVGFGAAGTGRPVRWEDDGSPSARLPDGLGHEGLRSAVGAPIVVEGRSWGGVVVGSRHARLPGDTEERLAEFNELVATAIASAEAQSDLVRSRARIVAAADQARRRLERDLHDGAQQRLVALVVRLRAARLRLPAASQELGTELDLLVAGLTEVLEELRTLARSIHPPVLSEGGLRHAVTALARRSPIPVDLDVRIGERLPRPVESGAYYVLAAALADAVPQASSVTLRIEATDDVLRIVVQDDAAGGTAAGARPGLVGIRDRVEAVGGRMAVDSPPGEGTTLRVELPLGGRGP